MEVMTGVGMFLGACLAIGLASAYDWWLKKRNHDAPLTPQREIYLMNNNDAIFSTMVRAGKTTYFVDVREAKNGTKYLQIAENSISGEERKRQTVRIFGESIEPFVRAIKEAGDAAND